MRSAILARYLQVELRMESLAFWLKVVNLVMAVVLNSVLFLDWLHHDDPRRTSKGVALILGGLFCLVFAIYLVVDHITRPLE